MGKRNVPKVGQSVNRAAQPGSTDDLSEIIFSNTHTCIAYMDSHFNFIRVNRAYAQADDRSPDDFPGKNHFDLYPDAENESIFRRVVETGETYFSFSKPYTYPEHPERGVTYWDWSLQPIKAQEGRTQAVVLIMVNVTTRVQAEKVAEESRALFEHLFESDPDGNILVDTAGIIQATNRAIEKLFGYKREELIGRKIEILIPDSLKDYHVSERHRYMEHPRIRPLGMDLNLVGRRKDGREFPADIILAPLMTSSRQIILAVVRDISGRKAGENALRQSEARFRVSIETMLDGFAILSSVRDPAGKIIDFRYEYINEAGCRLNQRSRDEQVGHNLLDLLPAHRETGLFDAYVCVVDKSEPLVIDTVDYEDIYGQGSRLKRAFNIQAVKLEDGFAVTWRDITERKQIEAELAELRRRLMDNVEAERRRLAQDLHDGPIQELYGVSFHLQDAIGPDREGSVEPVIDEAVAAIQEIIHTLREISGELRPPTLIHFGLKKAILSQIEKFQDSHPEIIVTHHLAVENLKLTEQASLGMFRIFQQALINVERHAQATLLYVNFYLQKDDLILEVQDDGKGFDLPGRWIDIAREGHLGLVGSAERAEAMGGRLEIESKAGKGALIRAAIPLAKNSA